MSAKPSATQSVVKGLADFLKANMPSVKKAYYNWPAPNEQLEYPALSVMARIPEFRGLSPYTIWRGEKDPATNLAKYRRVVGIWDFSLQVDLWSSYKPQREQLLAELVEAFSLDPMVSGLNIQLQNYFDQWASYTLGNPQFVDGELGSQQNEWRVTAIVTANCRAVREYSGSLIETIENHLEILDEVDGPVDPDTAAIV